MTSGEYRQEPLPGMTLESSRIEKDPSILGKGRITLPGNVATEYFVVESDDPELTARRNLFGEASLITRDANGLLRVSVDVAKQKRRYQSMAYGSPRKLVSAEAGVIASFISEEQRRAEEHEVEMQEAIKNILGS